MRVLVVENLRDSEPVWWLRHIVTEARDCELEVLKLSEERPLRAALPIMRLWISVLRDYDAVVTQQDGYSTLALAFLRRMVLRRDCRHYVNEFITREPESSLYSRLKYAFLRFAMHSVQGVFCCSRRETTLYPRILGMDPSRFHFAPLATDPAFLEEPEQDPGDYLIAAGRTGRDYATLIDAVRGLPLRVVLVAAPGNLHSISIPENVNVSTNIPLRELLALTARARFAVLPLQDRPVSIGQSVLLQAMSLGKATIATRTTGTEDYIRDGVTGFLVPPRDSAAMRSAIERLAGDQALADRMGKAARREVRLRHHPRIQAARIASVVRRDGGSRPRTDL